MYIFKKITIVYLVAPIKQTYDSDITHHGFLSNGPHSFYMSEIYIYIQLVSA